jgi:hypothetical protein
MIRNRVFVSEMSQIGAITLKIVIDACVLAKPQKPGF